MWELRNKLSRGRISLRRFSLLVTSVMMTFFVTATALTGTAFAESATRSGDNVVFQGKTLTPAPLAVIDAAKPANAPANTSGYYFNDAQAKKAYFIFTSGPAKDAAKGFYVIYDFTPPQNYSNPSPPTDVDISGTSGPSNGPVSNCSDSVVAGIGWIVCPVVTFLAKGMDMIYGIISNFLVVSTVTNDTSSSIYRLWTIVRDIANICFVIVFLIIVYSQITSIGISNYGIKHMLPRLIIAAILVNVSYWICAVGVDISNILGASIHNIFVGIMEKINTGSQYSNVTVPSWELITAAVLSGGALVAGIGIAIAANTFTGAIFLLIPFLVSVILAALVALIILAARQALITCLIIIAPLAMVAYVLPNTEKYFDKWRSAFMTLLLLFPIFSVIFSGAQLAGLAIIQNAGGNILTIILGMAVQVAPIVVTPMLVKFSGGIIGKIAGIVNNPNKGLIDRTRNWSQGMAQERKNKVLAGQTKHFNGRLGAIHAGTRALDNRRRRIDGKRKAYEAMADNRFAATNQGQMIEAMNRSAANDKQRVENTFASSARGRQLELQSRHLGAEKQEIENSLLRSEGGQRLTQRQHMADIDKTRVSNEFEQSQFGHQVDRAKRVVEAEKKRIENTHQANWDTVVQTDPGLKELELSVKASEVNAALAKGKLDKMHAEIAVKGADSEHVMNLRGANAHLQQGVLDIAKQINRASVEASLTNTAKVSAEQELSSQVNDIMLGNKITVDGIDARTYAAGIGSTSSVLAEAVARSRKEFGEHVAQQRELASHFKLNASQIEDLAMGKAINAVKDGEGNTYTFDVSDEHVRDMAAEDIFTVGSHNQKLKVLMSSGADYDQDGNLIEGSQGINYAYRRTIQQAAIKSNIKSIAPAIADKTLDDINNGKFNGMNSWQYHSFREVLEGRINMNSLSTANADSLKLLFEDIDSNDLTRTQFNNLLRDNIAGKQRELSELGLPASEADARQALIDQFNEQRQAMQKMAAQVLSNTTVRQSANSQSVDQLKRFAGSLYRGD